MRLHGCCLLNQGHHSGISEWIRVTRVRVCFFGFSVHEMSSSSFVRVPLSAHSVFSVQPVAITATSAPIIYRSTHEITATSWNYCSLYLLCEIICRSAVQPFDCNHLQPREITASLLPSQPRSSSGHQFVEKSFFSFHSIFRPSSLPSCSKTGDNYFIVVS